MFTKFWTHTSMRIIELLKKRPSPFSLRLLSFFPNFSVFFPSFFPLSSSFSFLLSSCSFVPSPFRTHEERVIFRGGAFFEIRPALLAAYRRVSVIYGIFLHARSACYLQKKVIFRNTPGPASSNLSCLRHLKRSFSKRCRFHLT